MTASSSDFPNEELLYFRSFALLFFCAAVEKVRLGEQPMAPGNAAAWRELLTKRADAERHLLRYDVTNGERPHHEERLLDGSRQVRRWFANEKIFPCGWRNELICEIRLFFLSQQVLFILSEPIFGAARDPRVLHSAKFITTVPSNAPMTEEMGFQKLTKSVILIVQTIEDPDETVRS